MNIHTDDAKSNTQ